MPKLVGLNMGVTSYSIKSNLFLTLTSSIVTVTAEACASTTLNYCARSTMPSIKDLSFGPL